MQNDWNLRNATRTPTSDMARIYVDENSPEVCALKDLSRTGASFTYSGSLPPEFDMEIQGKGRMRVRIRRREGNRFGVMFIAASSI